jgi:hypothetical protein
MTTVSWASFRVDHQWQLNWGEQAIRYKLASELIKYKLVKLRHEPNLRQFWIDESGPVMQLPALCSSLLALWPVVSPTYQ